MGLLDQIGSTVPGVAGKGQAMGVDAVLLQQLISMFSKPGALNNLVSAFQGKGLGNVLQSWIGTGENLPISPDQVRAVLGQGTVSDLAKRAGIGEPEPAPCQTFCPRSSTSSRRVASCHRSPTSAGSCLQWENYWADFSRFPVTSRSRAMQVTGDGHGFIRFCRQCRLEFEQGDRAWRR
jgi:hypothetical protein